MKIKFDEINKLSDYENIIAIDDKGTIIFYDVADLGALKALSMDPNKLIGQK